MRLTLRSLQQDKQDDMEMELVARAHDGDQAALTTLMELVVDRYQPMVHGTAYSILGNHADAQDVSQKVFLTVMAKVKQLRDARRIAGWLKQVAVRTALNDLAKCRGRLRHLRYVNSDVLLAIAQADSDPFEEVARADREIALQVRLTRLA